MKKKFFGALAVLLVAPVLVSAQWDVNNAASSGLPKGTIYEIVQNLMNWLLKIFGFIAIIGFVISGIWYLTAAGDEDRMQMGKNGMIWSIIGVIVALSGYVIVQAVDKMLKGEAQF